MATLTATELAVLLGVIAGVFTILGASIGLVGEALLAGRQRRADLEKDRRETRRAAYLDIAEAVIDAEAALSGWLAILVEIPDFQRTSNRAATLLDVQVQHLRDSTIPTAESQVHGLRKTVSLYASADLASDLRDVLQALVIVRHSDWPDGSAELKSGMLGAETAERARQGLVAAQQVLTKARAGLNLAD